MLEEKPTTIQQALEAFEGYKVCMHRYKISPERWQVQARGITVHHQGDIIEALVRLKRTLWGITRFL